MEVIDVKSKIILKIGYDEEKQELVVVFKTGKRYLYSNVSIPHKKHKDIFMETSMMY